MNTVPIVERELRVTTRKRVTYWWRLAGAVLGCGIAAWLLMRDSVVLTPAQMGAHLFAMLSNLAFMACLGAGVLLTADCISEEKREGTLGLLFLTDLKGRDVVFGKLAVTSLHALYAVFGALPVMAIPFLLGGVTVDELWRMALVLVNTLFFSLAVGVFISTLNVKERRAMFITAVVLFAVGLAFHFLGGGLRTISPRFAYELAFEGSYLTRPHSFYWSCLWVHGVAWGLLLWACWLVPQSWQEEPVKPAVAPDEAISLWPVLDETTGEPLPLGAPPLRDGNPIEWLADRDGRTPVWMWITLVGSALAWMMVHPSFNSGRSSIELAVLGGMLFHAILKCWIAWEATLRFSADRRCGALEVLLSTPLTVREIIRGQLTSLFKLFLKPLLAVLVVDLALLISGLQGQNSPTGSSALTLTGAIMTMMFVLDVPAVALQGLWQGVRARRASMAMLWTVGRVMLLPSALFAVAMIAEFWTRPRFAQPGRVTGMVMLWFGIGAINAGLCIFGGLAALEKNFRELATRQVGGDALARGPVAEILAVR